VPACPVCGAIGGTVLHIDLTDNVSRCAPGLWTLRRCRRCGCAYLDPRPTPDSISLAYSQYATHGPPANPNEPPISVPGRVRRALRNGYLARNHGCSLAPRWSAGAWILPMVPGAARRTSRYVRHLDQPQPGARLLDVGCGNGSFLLEMRSAGWQVHGVEPDAAAAGVALEAGLQITVGQLSEGTFPPEHFDVVTLNHVIEHVHDPVATLRTCRSVLKPSGRCWVATPNLSAEGHRRYGRDWRGLEPPRHLVIFTPSSLAFAFERAGFASTVRLPAGADSGPMFRASESIAGKAPGRRRLIDGLAPVLADLRAWRDPDRAEELVVLAER
jgi:SAM-dependent methyltransferase